MLPGRKEPSGRSQGKSRTYSLFELTACHLFPEGFDFESESPCKFSSYTPCTSQLAGLFLVLSLRSASQIFVETVRKLAFYGLLFCRFNGVGLTWKEVVRLSGEPDACCFRTTHPCCRKVRPVSQLLGALISVSDFFRG